MEKLNSKKKIAVFISGRGSNLKNLINYSKLKKSSFKVCLVLSNKSNAKGLKYAKINKIKKYVFEKRLSLFEKKALKLIKKFNINIVCLAGFMRILTPLFLKRVKIPVINIHPSLLPRLRGLNTHSRAIKAKHKYSGCTVHFVNDKLDSGKIILQKKVKISKNETKDSLAKKILIQEHKLYPKAILKVFNL